MNVVLMSFVLMDALLISSVRHVDTLSTRVAQEKNKIVLYMTPFVNLSHPR